MKKIKALLIALAFAFTLCSCSDSSLGNINHSSAEAETSVSNFTFDGADGEKIKFSFRTKAKEGEVDFVLYNSEGDEIIEFDRAKALETYVVLSSDGVYKLAAEYKNFIGSFSVEAVRTEE